MQTLNITIPEKLKAQSAKLIEEGYFASMSDLVRTSLRNILRNFEDELDLLKAKSDHRKGKGTILKSQKDIEDYFKNI